MSKKTIYILIGGAVVIIASLIILSKTGVIGNKDKGTEVEIAQVIPTTIVETVSATGKIQPKIKVKISTVVSGEIISLHVKEGKIVKIVRHEKDTVVGTFQKSRNFTFVVPDDKNFGTDIFISKNNDNFVF